MNDCSWQSQGLILSPFAGYVFPFLNRWRAWALLYLWCISLSAVLSVSSLLLPLLSDVSIGGSSSDFLWHLTKYRKPLATTKPSIAIDIVISAIRSGCWGEQSRWNNMKKWNTRVNIGNLEFIRGEIIRILIF